MEENNDKQFSSEDLKNAEMQGYLRGKNERIEAAVRASPEEVLPAEPQPERSFPRFARRSVWDATF